MCAGKSETDAMVSRVATADLGFGLVILAGAGFGLNPLFAKMAYAAGLGPSGALLWRFVGLMLLTLPFLPRAARTPGHFARGLALGAAMALGTLSYFRALEVLPVATAAMVYYTYPLFTVAIGWFVLRRRPKPRAFYAAGLVLVAVALVVSPGRLAADQWTALLACFLAPLAFATMLQAFQSWFPAYTLMERSSTTALGHTLVLLPAAFIWSDGLVVPESAAGWQAVVGIATLASLLPQLCLMHGVTRAGAERTAVGGSTELMMSVTLGWVVFAEPIQPTVVAGVAVLLAAIYVARRPLTQASSIGRGRP
jgi:drug/metabolite transporter (DMT)-like permease